MPDPTYIAQVTIPRMSGIPADVVVNTWHFQGDSVIDESDEDRWDTLAPGLMDRLATFYTAIGGYYASSISGEARVTLYNIRDPKPRAPKIWLDFTMGKGSKSLPAEVAYCLSFRATLDSGTNPARRRGRVYLGPFSPNALWDAGSAAVGDARPAPLMTTDILTQAATMAHGTGGAARLVVYSPTTDVAGTLEESTNDVTTLWMDNAWDTQRRRGAPATARETVELSG